MARIFEEVHEDRISYDIFLKICRADNGTVAPPAGKDPPTSSCEHHPHQIRKRRRSSVKTFALEAVKVGQEAEAAPEVVTPKDA